MPLRITLFSALPPPLLYLCPSGKESNDDVPSVGDHSCQICFEHEHSTVMLPCGHGGVCWDCGVQMFALTEECPMCRNKIDLVRSKMSDYISRSVNYRRNSCYKDDGLFE